MRVELKVGCEGNLGTAESRIIVVAVACVVSLHVNTTLKAA